MRDVVLQLHFMGEANRQRAGVEACGGRHQSAPYRIAALAVEHFARAKVAFCYGGDVSMKIESLPGRLATQRR